MSDGRLNVSALFSMDAMPLYIFGLLPFLFGVLVGWLIWG